MCARKPSPLLFRISMHPSPRDNTKITDLLWPSPSDTRNPSAKFHQNFREIRPTHTRKRLRSLTQTGAKGYQCSPECRSANVHNTLAFYQTHPTWDEPPSMRCDSRCAIVRDYVRSMD